MQFLGPGLAIGGEARDLRRTRRALDEAGECLGAPDDGGHRVVDPAPDAEQDGVVSLIDWAGTHHEDIHKNQTAFDAAHAD
ncbi:hypothetical protein GCM10017772_45420 [Promicromonospora soli]|uniref:Uncharacterized protein n=1 Tax=Promicromonospora soli TaxID=2035533 RepID=A0A919G7L5_9MICO|nr:hypothetical protein GCM10017772_45420 [Promicromonospora soli]